MTIDEARNAYEEARAGRGEEGQVFTYLRYRLLATDDADERTATANSMRHMVGLPPAGHGLSRNMWAILNSQAMQRPKRTRVAA